MSPLWRDEVGISVAPGSVVLNRMRRGIRPHCVAEEYQGVNAPDEQGWGAPLQVLASALKSVKWQDAAARIVVANIWTRFAMVPWAAGLNSDERIVHARHILEQTFGEMSAEWKVTVSDALPGQDRLACAIPVALFDGLAAIAHEARLKVLSLQPHLVVAFNCARAQIAPGTGWFVSMSAGSLAAAQFGPDGWQQVRSIRIGDDWNAELQRLRRFGRLTARSADDARVFVDAPFCVSNAAQFGGEGLEVVRADRARARDTLQMLVAIKSMCP